jgi:hypothetical protein
MWVVVTNALAYNIVAYITTVKSVISLASGEILILLKNFESTLKIIRFGCTVSLSTFPPKYIQ